jgi:hypothetical protein
MVKEQPEREHWTLDKRVPIALLLGLVGSTLAVGGTAVIAHHRLGNVETHVARIEGRLERDAVERRQFERENGTREAAIGVAMAELRATTQALREGVAELRAAVRQMQVPQRRGSMEGNAP